METILISTFLIIVFAFTSWEVTRHIPASPRSTEELIVLSDMINSPVARATYLLEHHEHVTEIDGGSAELEELVQQSRQIITQEVYNVRS